MPELGKAKWRKIVTKVFAKFSNSQWQLWIGKAHLADRTSI